MSSATMIGVIEEWRDVVGFDDYEVSNLGRVRSWRRRSWNATKPITTPRLLKLSPAANGYCVIRIGDGNRRKTMYVHEIVLLSFVGPRPNGYVCRHFPNREKTDNRLANLAWGTEFENSADKRAHGTIPLGDSHWTRRIPEAIPRGEDRTFAKLTDEKVRAMKSMLSSPGITCRAVAEVFGVHRVHVNRIRLGKIWSHVL